MPTEEQRQRLRELNLQRRREFMEQESVAPPQRQRNPEQPGLVSRFFGSTPVRTVFEAPEYLRDEAIQRYMETKEAFNEQGFLGGLGHMGREALSDIANPTGIVGTTNPLADWIDPSKDTEIGARVEAEYQNFRDQNMGKDPSMAEKYDIMQNVQNEINPWLAETKNMMGMDITHRGLIGLPVEAGVIGLEVAATGGAATLAKTLGRTGAREAAQKAPKSLSGQAAQGAKNVAREAARQTLLIPKRIDDVVATTLKWTVGKPIQYTFKAGAKGLGGAKWAADILYERVMKKGAEEGLPAADVAKKATEQTRINTGDPNYINNYNATLGNIYGIPQLNEATPEKILLDKDSIFSTGMPAEIVTEPGAVKSKYNTAIATLDSVWRRVTGNPQKTAEEIKLENFGKATVKGLARQSDIHNTQVEGISYLSRLKVASTINFIRNEFPDLLRPNKVESPKFNLGSKNLIGVDELGNKIEEAMLGKESSLLDLAFHEDYFTKNNIVTRSGEKATILGNTRVSDDYVYEIRNTRGRNNTEISQEQINKGIDESGNNIVEKIYLSNSLLPDFAEVVERLPRFKTALEALEVTVDDALIEKYSKKLISGTIETRGDEGIEEIVSVLRRKKGEKINVYELMKEVKDEADIIETQLFKDYGETLGAKTGRGVLYSEGAANFPRQVITMVDNRYGGEIIEGNKVNHRKFASGSEANYYGYHNAPPEIALHNRALYVGRKNGDLKKKALIQQAANDLGVEYGTVHGLLGKSFYQSVENNYADISTILKSIARQGSVFDRKTKTLRPNMSLAKSINKIIDDIESFDVVPVLTPDAAKGPGEILIEEKKRLLKHFGKDTGVGSSIRKIINSKQITPNQKNELERLLSRSLDNINSLGNRIDETKDALDEIGLQGYNFPTAFRNVVAQGVKDIRRFDPDKQRNVMENINNMMRTYGATGDMSAIGIQGWATIMNDIRERATSLGMDKELKVLSNGDGLTAVGESWHALWRNGDIVVQDFFNRASLASTINGTASPNEAVRVGLAILGNAPDMGINRQQFGFLERVTPGFLKNFDRSFTHYGNVIRYQLFDHEMGLRMLEKNSDGTFKTAQQLIDSGDAAQIAASINKLTGVGARVGVGAFSGNIGQFLIFAPRFFKARIDTLVNAGAGLAKGDEANLQQQVARRYMSTLVGMHTFLTVGINSMMGEETDFQPWKRNEATGEIYFNNNFMRTHIGDLDISFLGPYDTILRLASLPFIIPINAKQQGISINQMAEDVRGAISGPLITKFIDLMTGENAIGQRTTSVIKKDEKTGEISEEYWLKSPEAMGEVAKTLLDGLVPFAWDEVFFGEAGKPGLLERAGEGVADIASGEIVEGTKDVATAGTQFVGQMFGVKSSYETLNEAMDEAEAGILELGPSDIRLQEAFDMSEKELGIFLAQHGSGLWHDGKLDIGAGIKSVLTGEVTPDFTDLAKDYQKNIQRMQEEGRFPEFFSPDEWESMQEKTKQRLEESRDDYSLYKLKRDSLLEQELVELEKLEEAFKSGTMYENPITGEKVSSGEMQDVATFHKKSRNLSASFARRRRALTDPIVGEFKEIDELFKFGRESSLGKISNSDADIYDFAQATYYDKLWDEEDGIVMPDGDINCEKREIKLVQWADEMKARYPSLSDSDIASYLFRAERKAKKDAPPIKKALMEMTDSIKDSGYYDIERDIFYNQLDKANVSTKIRGELVTLYSRWKQQSAQDRKVLEEQRPILKSLSDLSKQQKEIFRMRNPRIDAMLRVVSSNKSKEALTNYGTVVDAVMINNRKKALSEEKMLAFFYDILNEEVTYEQAYKNLYQA